MEKFILTIEQVEKEFAIWRDNKKGQSSIPEALSHQVKILLRSHKHSEVLRRLGLSMQQARNKRLLPLSTVATHHPQNPPTSFIKIPMMQPATSAVSPGTTSLTLQRGDIQLSLNSPSHEQIQLIINTFMR